MTPTALVDLAETKDLMKNGQFRLALEKLNILTLNYPSDNEVQQLIRICLDENARFANRPPGVFIPKPPSPEVTITIKNPGCLAAVLFVVIVAAIMASFFLIFYVFGFTLKIRPGLIQDYIGFLSHLAYLF